MRRMITMLFVLSLLPLLCLSAQEVKPTVVEYWFDGHFDTRQSLNANNITAQDIDVGSLCMGIHTLEMRVGDTKGRWSVSLLRFFLKGDNTPLDNTQLTYTYWIDNDRENALTGKMNDTMMADIDVSGLCEGIHTLLLNVSDSRGRQSHTYLRYFLKPGPSLDGQHLTSYRYWIDDASKTVEGVMTDGSLLLDIDVSRLCKGIHTLFYQVADNGGKLSAPAIRYFLVPDLRQGTGQIAAYEYWFNLGPCHHVEVEPSQSISLQDVVVEVKDVVPNSLDGYVFDAATERVIVADNVVFGLRVVNGAGMSSGAVIPDTFAMLVPVDPHFISLANGEERQFATPAKGMMQGLRLQVEAGDSLLLCLSAQGLRADFYDADGQPLKAEKETLPTGQTQYLLQATTNKTFALLYGASYLSSDVVATLTVSQPSGIACLSDGIELSASKQQIAIRMEHPARVRLTDLSGKVVYDEYMAEGRTVVNVPSGVYIVSIDRMKHTKLLVE